MIDISESASEKKFNGLSRYDSLAHDLKNRNLAGQAPFAGGKIVSIAVVARHESVTRCLVAMTANGESTDAVWMVELKRQAQGFTSRSTLVELLRACSVLPRPPTMASPSHPSRCTRPVRR